MHGQKNRLKEMTLFKKVLVGVSLVLVLALSITGVVLA
jgi:hypothetical protein